MSQHDDVPHTDPGLALLTTRDVEDLLEAAVNRAGGHVIRWSLRDVDVRPGDRTTATYAAVVAWPEGENEETLGASVTVRGTETEAPAEAPRTAGERLVLTDGTNDVEVWRFPFDPELPALPAATFSEPAVAMLQGLGVDTSGLTLRVVSYRPRKRAVVEVTTPAGRIFLKVLRPRALPEILRRHRLLADAKMPVPRVVAHSTTHGLLALGALPGVSLDSALAHSDAGAVRGSDLVALLDRLPDAVRQLPRRAPWAAHVGHYADVVAAALPHHAARLESFAAHVESELRTYGDGDEPTHGDFYEAQVFVADGAVTGLLDVDTVGPGRRADDLACLLAHLSVLTLMAPGSAGGARDALEHWQPVFERQVDRHELRTRAAAVVMSLATGPFRAQEPGWAAATGDRIALAERWLDSAGHGTAGRV